MQRALQNRKRSRSALAFTVFAAISLWASAAAYSATTQSGDPPKPAEVRSFVDPASATAFLEERLQVILPNSLCVKNPTQEKCNGIDVFLVSVTTDPVDGFVNYPRPVIAQRQPARINGHSGSLCGVMASTPVRVLVGGTNWWAEGKTTNHCFGSFGGQTLISQEARSELWSKLTNGSWPGTFRASASAGPIFGAGQLTPVARYDCFNSAQWNWRTIGYGTVVYREGGITKSFTAANTSGTATFACP